MDEKQEVQRLRQRVQLLEALIDKQTTLLCQKPGHALLIAMELRRACGLPPRPPKRRMTGWLWWVLICVAVFAAIAVGALLYF